MLEIVLLGLLLISCFLARRVACIDQHAQAVAQFVGPFHREADCVSIVAQCDLITFVDLTFRVGICRRRGAQHCVRATQSLVSKNHSYDRSCKRHAALHEPPFFRDRSRLDRKEVAVDARTGGQGSVLVAVNPDSSLTTNHGDGSVFAEFDVASFKKERDPPPRLQLTE